MAKYQVTCEGLPDGYYLGDYARAAGVKLEHDTLDGARAAALAIESCPDQDGVVPVCLVLEAVRVRVAP